MLWNFISNCVLFEHLFHTAFYPHLLKLETQFVIYYKLRWIATQFVMYYKLRNYYKLQRNNAHVALDDVKSLLKLVNARLREHFSEDDLYSVNHHSSKLSYAPLVEQHIVSKALCENLARHGLSLSHLRMAGRRDQKGVKLVLQNHGVSMKQAKALIEHLSSEEWVMYLSSFQ